MEFCTKCGNKLEDHWLICPKCGTSLKEIDKSKQEDIILQQETITPHKTPIIDKKIDEIEKKEKRFVKDKKTLALSISLVVVCVLAGVLGILYIQTDNKYGDLTGDYNDLIDNYDDLSEEYDELLNNYQILTGDYDTLFDNYQDLQNSYNAICSVIRQSILPVQYSIFAEAVRRYYKDIYIGGLTGKLYWKAFAKFCRDIILHDSEQYNSFNIVSDAFSDALKYGSNTMYLVFSIMCFTFYPWIPNWDNVWLTGNELTDIDTIVDWCIDEIDYEYDSDITERQEYFGWDYIKFPVETAFRTMGDCEDQAILCATYLESCELETAIAIHHDPNHPTLGEFFHGSLLVHIEDTDAFWDDYPSAYLWNLGGIDPYSGFTWCWLDTTWDVPFGSTPSWLQDYIGIGGISDDIISVAVCDIDGDISENLGLTCVMST